MKSYNFTKQSVSHISQTVKTVDQLTTDLTRPKKPRPITKQSDYNGPWKVQKVSSLELKVTDLLWGSGQGLIAGVDTNLIVTPGSWVVYANFSPVINYPYISVTVDYNLTPISGIFYVILASIVVGSYEISTIKQIQYGSILINSIII